MSIAKSLVSRLLVFAAVIALTTGLLVFVLTSAFAHRPGLLPLGLIGALALVLAIALRLGRAITRDLTSLEVALFNLSDQNFSVALATPQLTEIKQIAGLFNKTFEKLRSERQSIYQKELMLDKVMQNSPMAMLLVNDRGIVVYSNLAARRLFGDGRARQGNSLATLTAQLPEAFAKAISERKETLFHLSGDRGNATYHYSSGRFSLHTQHHYLHLFKDVTREINRQEIATWKKVIRVISHELNNSLAPISSMTHSSKLLAGAGEAEQLKGVLDRIEQNVKNLHQFIQGYAAFARLPLPQKAPVDWHLWVQTLRDQYSFTLGAPIPDWPLQADTSQLHQVVTNLLKNAHESGSPVEDIVLTLARKGRHTCIEVADRGPGMSAAVMESALIPFYSTKPLGSGLGLALCQEIIQAHGGRLSLQNRAEGGLSVTITLG